MNTSKLCRQPGRSPARAQSFGLIALAAAAWELSIGQAQARGGHDDIFWSIGIHQPGVTVGVSNALPPRPVVIHQPPPVVIHQPAPVVIHNGAPVVIHQHHPYVRPVVVYQGWRYGPRWDERHERRYWKHKKRDRHDRDDDRWDDDDDRRGGGWHR